MWWKSRDVMSLVDRATSNVFVCFLYVFPFTFAEIPIHVHNLDYYLMQVLQFLMIKSDEKYFDEPTVMDKQKSKSAVLLSPFRVQVWKCQSI